MVTGAANPPPYDDTPPPYDTGAAMVVIGAAKPPPYDTGAAAMVVMGAAKPPPYDTGAAAMVVMGAAKPPPHNIGAPNPPIVDVPNMVCLEFESKRQRVISNACLNSARAIDARCNR